MDRTAGRDMAEALANTGLEGKIYHDVIGPAVYVIEPQPATVAACMACRQIGLIPSIPKVPKLVWTCPGCGQGWALEPPAIVWIEGSRPSLIVPRVVQ